MQRRHAEHASPLTIRSFRGLELPLGLLIWPLGLFVVLAESNATNLTDGLDGLASGCGALVSTLSLIHI